MASSSVFIAMSLDGYIANSDGSLDWLKIVEEEGQDYGFAKFFTKIDAIVMGRKTYEKVLEFDSWPFADKEVWVITSSGLRPKHSEKFSHNLEVTLRALSSQHKNVYLDGGKIVSSSLNLKSVDKITLSVIPIILGSGIPLFEGINKSIRLVLESTQSFPKGLVQLVYNVIK